MIREPAFSVENTNLYLKKNEKNYPMQKMVKIFRLSLF